LATENHTMLVSMTGYGKANGSFATKNITAEIKSLNSKQFDLTVKLPTAYREKELSLRGMLAEKLGRGKVDLNITIEDAEDQKRVTINQSLALAYLKEINLLADAGGLQRDKNILSALLSMPDVLQSEKNELDENEWNAVVAIVEEAADAMVRFREIEGARLEKDIQARVESIEKLRQEVDAYLPERLQTVRERIEKNLDDLVNHDEADKNRLEQEIIYYLEKLDITEEHTRLKGHCIYFMDTMKETGMVGKKLAFISQEMGREINTMGSKANHVAIQKLVVEMKDELEKIKEQLLNIS